MLLTKKRLASLTILMTIIFFILLLQLPEGIVGERGDDFILFAMKILFLGMTLAITVAFILILVFKREFVEWQTISINKYKNLLWLLIKRDFYSKYRKSILGVLWSLLNPLFMMLVLTAVFSYMFRHDIPNFPVYFLSGRLVYDLFTESTTMAMNSVIASEGIIKKIYVPKYIFPVSRVLSSLVNSFFFLIAFFLVVIITGAPFYWTMLLIPIPLFYVFIFSLGIAMLLSSMAVFFRDLAYLYGVFTLLLFFATPIMFPIEMLPGWLTSYIGLNPIFQFVQYFRDLTMNGVVPDLWSNLVCIGFALMALCIGTYAFMTRQDRFILNL